MKTKYFTLLVAVTILATFLAILFAAVPAGASHLKCFQANYGEDTVVKNGHVVEAQIDLYTRHQECAGETSLTEAPANVQNEVQEVLQPISTPVVTQEVPTEAATEAPTQEIVVEQPTQAPAATEAPKPTTEPTDCPLNTNRAGNTNHSCFHPDDNSGQEQNTVHPAPKTK